MPGCKLLYTTKSAFDFSNGDMRYLLSKLCTTPFRLNNTSTLINKNNSKEVKNLVTINKIKLMAEFDTRNLIFSHQEYYKEANEVLFNLYILVTGRFSM